MIEELRRMVEDEKTSQGEGEWLAGGWVLFIVEKLSD
jgi:hypothetical protein